MVQAREISAAWLQRYRTRQVQDRDHGAIANEPNADRVARLMRSNGVQRYDDFLEKIKRRELQDTKAFAGFRKIWQTITSETVMITGGQKTGKSTMALWACKKCCESGKWFSWVDAPELATMVARRSWDRIDQLRKAPLAVIDSLELYNAFASGEIHSVLTARYREAKPTILVGDIDRKKVRFSCKTVQIWFDASGRF